MINRRDFFRLAAGAAAAAALPIPAPIRKATEDAWYMLIPAQYACPPEAPDGAAIFSTWGGGNILSGATIITEEEGKRLAEAFKLFKDRYGEPFFDQDGQE